MNSGTRRPLTREEKKTCENLKRVWTVKKRELDLTQVRICEKLGITQAAFSQFINGLIPIPTKTLMAIALALKISVKDISPELGKRLEVLQAFSPEKRTLPVLFSLNDTPHPAMGTVPINNKYSKNSAPYLVFVDQEIGKNLYTGDYFIVDGLRPPRIQHNVFVHLFDNTKYIGKLLEITEFTVTLKTLDTQKTLVIDNSLINIMHDAPGVHRA